MKKTLERISGPTIRLTKGRSLPIEFATRVKPHVTVLSSGPCREVDFAHLPNGTLVDLIRDRVGELRFAVFKDGATSLQRELRHENVELITPRVDSGLRQAVRFPTAVGVSCSARELLLEIEDVFHVYADCDPSDRKLLAHFALYSWVWDLSPVAPYIWIVGPYGFGKTTLLQIMSAICRRSILAGDVSLASLYRVTTGLHPTLLIDEFDGGKDSRNRQLLRLLRAGSTMGQKILRGSNAYEVFGPKIIVSHLGPGDAALESRGFYVVARQLSRNVSGLTPVALESIAEQLQPKLMAFRLHNYERLKSLSAASTVISTSSPRVQQMERALALPIVGDKELERQIVTIVDTHVRQAHVGRDSEPGWFVTIALLHLAHLLGPGAPVRWPVKRIVKNARINADRAGQSFNETCRATGEILRALGLQTCSLGSIGRGLKSSSPLRDKIHEIAKTLGICAGDLLSPEYPDTPVSCDLCERYGLNFDNEGRKLRFSRLPKSITNPEDDEY